MDQVEILLNHRVETINFVQILLPDELCAEHTVGHFLRVAGSPQLLQQVHDLLVVVGHDLRTVLTLATLVVGDDGGQTEHQSLWQFALALQIGLHTR